MNIKRKERGQFPLIDVAYLPVPCMHCDEADCLKGAKDEAVYKREDGIVIIDPLKAKGQKAVVDSCPYGTIWWNEELDVPQKCTLCAHLLDKGWKEPRCVQACPTEALKFLRLEDSEMQQIIESEKLEALHPEYGTEPRLYYKNLYRFARCFIGGSIALKANGLTDCVEGARITLLKNSTKLAETTSDNYGDFKFDNLEENSGQYSLEIVYPDYETKMLEVDLKASVNVGTIWLG
jgi:Fe-S-cluster-containing dehydrogenase component